jgi:hypothetical protein
MEIGVFGRVRWQLTEQYDSRQRVGACQYEDIFPSALLVCWFNGRVSHVK